MQASKPANVAAMSGRGVLAGTLGTGVMTAFQKLIEMPVTGRKDSYAPADFVERVLPVHPDSARGRKRLNYVAHFALGMMRGGVYGVANYLGLRGQKAINVVFASLYTGEIALNTALGLYKPARWSTQDWVVDLVDKYVQAQSSGLIFNRFLKPEHRS